MAAHFHIASNCRIGLGFSATWVERGSGFLINCHAVEECIALATYGLKWQRNCGQSVGPRGQDDKSLFQIVLVRWPVAAQ